jgi:TPR repeat protein
MSNHDPETENHIAELIRAAEAGNADAQCYLAWSYDEGEGVEVDHEKVFYWYPKARKVLKKLEATQNEQ